MYRSSTLQHQLTFNKLLKLTEKSLKFTKVLFVEKTLKYRLLEKLLKNCLL